MASAPGDGEYETTQVLSDGDLEEVRDRTDARPSANTQDDTRVMDDSQLRELMDPKGKPTQPSEQSEAAFRRQRDAERAAREREAALARVKAHRRQSANTRALRPAGTPPPEQAKVELSRSDLEMLEHQIEPSDRPPAAAPANEATAAPAIDAKAAPAPLGEPTPTLRPPGATTRPQRGTVPLRRPTPAVAASTVLPTRVSELLTVLDEVERLLRAGDVQTALETIVQVRRD